jgi:hypothetical protein
MSQTLDNLTYTWNASGITFTGIKYNVTDTASASGSLLMDLQVGGTSRFSVSKTGCAITTLKIPLSPTPIMWFSGNAANTGIGATHGPGFVVSGVMIGYFTANGFYMNNRPIQVGNSFYAWASDTTRLFEDANNTLAQRNGTNAQTKRLYGTFTDASNYRRLTQTMSTGGVAEIKPEGAGTGASGNVLHISGLPTSNPGAGILWNDGGTVKVGT